MSTVERVSKRFHLAGIIPIHGQAKDFGMPWHDCLMPLGPDYTALEAAAMECAWAGCETIWIVCRRGDMPLIRLRMGDWLIDPVSTTARWERELKKKFIAINYVPIDVEDMDRRDCLSWSVLHGIATAQDVSTALTKWLAPHKFYVTWPLGLSDPEELRSHRLKISSSKTRFLMTKGGKTAADGEYLSFTCTLAESKRWRSEFRKKATGQYDPSQPIEERKRGRFVTKVLPTEEKYSGRYFNLEDVFDFEEEKTHEYEPSWYYNIGSWAGYRSFLGSENYLERPSRDILKYREWYPIGIDNEEERNENEDE